MPESVNRRGSSGPTIGAIVGFSCSGVVAMDGTRIRLAVGRTRGSRMELRPRAWDAALYEDHHPHPAGPPAEAACPRCARPARVRAAAHRARRLPEPRPLAGGDELAL